MATVIPFPVFRRQAFIDRQAQRAAQLNSDAGERYIAHQIEVQAAAMRRKGIGEDLITRESKCLEGAIRASLWRLVITPGGAA
ncbi:MULTISPECIES: DUF6074 family protein [unclassified Afipia]|uniref:DUF6074 family protein n=1 Tax=unclassified Afipia TaxID=2642050 RepID=UPI0006879B12|nr:MULTISPECIES: DUF6074 family protein [unclassified Afipia]